MADTVSTPAPLTEIEALRVENLQLQRVIVQNALNDWQAKVRVLKADLERPRPDWEWEPDTGTWKRRPEERPR